jgi:hypothetical protein
MLIYRLINKNLNINKVEDSFAPQDIKQLIEIENLVWEEEQKKILEERSKITLKISYKKNPPKMIKVDKKNKILEVKKIIIENFKNFDFW